MYICIYTHVHIHMYMCIMYMYMYTSRHEEHLHFFRHVSPTSNCQFKPHFRREQCIYTNSRCGPVRGCRSLLVHLPNDIQQYQHWLSTLVCNTKELRSDSTLNWDKQIHWATLTWTHPMAVVSLSSAFCVIWFLLRCQQRPGCPTPQYSLWM